MKLTIVCGESDYDQEVDSFPGDASAISDAQDRTKQMSLVTDILGGATVVAAGVTLYIALSAGDDAPTREAVSVPTVRVGVGPSMLAVDGRF